MFVVTFEGFQPGPRHDGHPWVAARIDEAESKNGPWTTIETIELDPLDADPTEPMERNFTTEEATREQGWYKIVWLDADIDEQSTEAIFNRGSRGNFMPTVSEVGAMLRARTTDTNGNEMGTFTDDTRPTREQADKLIEQATERAVSKLGNDIPEEIWDATAHCIALYSAMLIELTYFPEQIGLRRSPYPEYERLWKECAADLIAASEEIEGGGELGPDAEDSLPIWAYPPASRNIW